MQFVQSYKKGTWMGLAFFSNFEQIKDLLQSWYIYFSLSK